MEVRIDNKIVIVTGSTQGIGEATARLAAESGAAGIMITGRDAARGRTVAAEIRGLGTEADFVAADLVNPSSSERIVEACIKSFGRVDGLVNAAALTDRASLLDGTVESWDRLFAANAHKEDRIRVNGIILGWTDTPAERRMQAETLGLGEGWLEEANKAQPFGRLLSVDDLAALAVFLLSEVAGPMTGALIDQEQRVADAPC